MVAGLEEGGRDVPNFPLKLDIFFVTSLLQGLASEVVHPGGYGLWHFFSYQLEKL